MNKKITDVKYVGEAVATRLEAHGITTLEQLAQASLEQLKAVPGIGASTAEMMIADAKRLLSGAENTTTRVTKPRAKAAPKTKPTDATANTESPATEAVDGVAPVTTLPAEEATESVAPTDPDAQAAPAPAKPRVRAATATPKKPRTVKPKVVIPEVVESEPVLATVISETIAVLEIQDGIEMAELIAKKVKEKAKDKDKKAKKGKKAKDKKKSKDKAKKGKKAKDKNKKKSKDKAKNKKAQPSDTHLSA
ncbi:helix-hairpin-helix domain-containing protein [Thiofilum flexile]|uniref:helix-hairpin-helix domain-containing protein n=1 Tax=Thiofilum flexile TaxID=125627 RepID=UPI000363B436|nr:helix-hairpin-helix domain-containing protein [Thiofilum flexile]